MTIHGVGLHGLKPAPGPIYLGNSGTSMRLLSGLLAAQNFDSTLTGDASLSKRPMNRVANPLREMGAVIETAAEGRPPMVIRGGHKLKGLTYTMPMASAQEICLLLAVCTPRKTTVTELHPLAITPSACCAASLPSHVDVATDRSSPVTSDCNHIEVPAISLRRRSSLWRHRLPRFNWYWISRHQSTRTCVIDILRLMVRYHAGKPREVGGEPVADRACGQLNSKVRNPEALVRGYREFRCCSWRLLGRGPYRLTGAESCGSRIGSLRSCGRLLALGVKCEPTRTRSY